MLTDYHTHSYRCGHATGTMREYVEIAISRGIGDIGLTDHLYLYWLPDNERDSRWAMQESEYDAHYREMLEIREEYRGRINVRVAVEADYIAGHEATLREVLSRYEFDFVLGSVHFMDGWLIDDIDQSHRYREERVAEIYRRYFRNLQGAIATGAFDVLAHFDLPKKFGFLPEDDLTGIVGETLDHVRDAGLCVEISSAGLRKPVGEIYPSATIVREMKRREIPIVLSSDAHAPDEIGMDFDRSLAHARTAGYETVWIFESRGRSEQPIG
jgi:histidinol-phosphatase (PHP family)